MLVYYVIGKYLYITWFPMSIRRSTTWQPTGTWPLFPNLSSLLYFTFLFFISLSLFLFFGFAISLNLKSTFQYGKVAKRYNPPFSFSRFFFFWTLWNICVCVSKAKKKTKEKKINNNNKCVEIIFYIRGSKGDTLRHSDAPPCLSCFLSEI